MTRDEKTEIQIQGNFRIGQDILIRDINHKLRKALGQVADPKINVKARATVGNHIGQIKSVYDLYQKREIDIVHKQGQVLVIVFWES